MTIARLFRFILAAVAICLVAWSFGYVTSDAIQAYRRTRSQPIKLTIMHWGEPAEDHIVEELVEKFQSTHPLVQIVRINAGGEFESKLKTMMAAGTPPDVFYLTPDDLPDLASMKLITPLDDRFAKEDAEWKKDFFPILLEGFHYDTDTQRLGQGHLYGLPKDFTTLGVYVNLDLFQKAGIAVPYGGWTWDQYEADMKKITALSGTPGFEGRDIFGGFLQLWPDTIREILWTYGGDFFGPGGFRDVALDSPASQAALQMIYRTRLIDKTVYNPTGVAKDGGDEFVNGNIGSIGPIGRWMAPRYKTITKFKWDMVPVPYKTAPASQIFYNAWTMSAQTKHPDECYELLKFLCGRDGQVQQAHLGLAVPCLQSVAYSQDFLNPPGGWPKVNTQLYLDALKYARLQQSPREPEWSRIVDDHITKSIQLGQETPLQSAQTIKRLWLAELDSPLRKQVWQPMKWSSILGITGGLLATVVFVLWMKARREKLGPIDRAQERAGWTFILPWMIGFLLLTMGPMIASLLLSFSKWSAMVPISQAESVGTANYQQLLIDHTFYKSIRVTLYFVILAVPIGQFAALAVAMLMNSKVRGIEIFRTIYFVPSVVGGAALSVMWLQIFNNQYGILNKVLHPFTHIFGANPPDWFGGDAAHWAIPGYVIMGLWGVGSGMIIYLAGLKGISASLYEAATIDGAGPARRFWNVTLPMLSPLLFYNLVMGIIGSFQVFTQVYIMTAGGPDENTLVYVMNLYRQAFEYHNMGYASALAWILFIIILVLTLFVFVGSKKLVYYEGLKN